MSESVRLCIHLYIYPERRAGNLCNMGRDSNGWDGCGMTQAVAAADAPIVTRVWSAAKQRGR